MTSTRSAGPQHDGSPGRRTSRPGPLRIALATVALLTGLATLRAGPLITEFMAANTATLADEDGAFSDWIEVHNPGPGPANLAGWFLTDTAANRTKWMFPEVVLAEGGFLVVWASGKNRRDPAGPLHTNFALSASGEYLGLIMPDGTTVASQFAPTYPPQHDDISYGVPMGFPAGGEAGFFPQPSPGRANGAAVRQLLAEKVSFSRPSGPFPEPFTVQLTGTAAGQRIRWVMTAPSDRGFDTPAPSASSEAYLGPLAITGSVHLRAAVFSDDGSGQGPVTDAHFVRLETGATGFAGTPPVLVLDDHGLGPLSVKDGIDHPAWLYGYASEGIAPGPFAGNPTLSTPATFTIRGQTSATFPKKSYNLKLRDETGMARTAALLGAGSYEKWALVSPWSYDPTSLANPLAYSLSRSLGRWAPRTQATELYLNTGATLANDDYLGISILVDRIEVGAGRVEITPLTPADTTADAVTGGYILKLDPKDDDEYGFVTQHGEPEDAETMVVVAYPKDADLAPAQRTYIRGYVQALENTLLADAAGGWKTRGYLGYLERASWVDHHILNSLAANPDAFRRSAYFTKDRGGRLQAGPLWDFDRAFNSTDLRNTGPEGWRGDADGLGSLWNIGWWRTLARDPEFMQAWIDRWQGLRRMEFSDPRITALIEALALTVGREAASREASRWPENASRRGDHAGEVNALQVWLARRAGWIDAQFTAAPDVRTSGDTLRITPPAGRQLAYTLDGTDPRSLGGALAPNALMTSAAIEVPAGANLHARSHHPGWDGGFPGSPWSSVVSGTAATPLVPAPRLANLSVLAQLGPDSAAMVTRVVVADSDAHRLLVRAVGPGLAGFGITGFIPDPDLMVRSQGGTVVAENHGWDATGALPALFRTAGAFPLIVGSRDAALPATVGSGIHELTVTSASGLAGLALTEVYDLETSGPSLALAVTGLAGPAQPPLLAGFVVKAPAALRLLVRAFPPPAPVNGTMPYAGTLELVLQGGSGVLAQNTAWSQSDNAPQLARAYLALALEPVDGEAAVFPTLPPGPCTVSVRGTSGADGVTILTINAVP